MPGGELEARLERRFSGISRAEMAGEFRGWRCGNGTLPVGPKSFSAGSGSERHSFSSPQIRIERGRRATENAIAEFVFWANHAGRAVLAGGNARGKYEGVCAAVSSCGGRPGYECGHNARAAGRENAAGQRRGHWAMERGGARGTDAPGYPAARSCRWDGV